MVRVSISIDAQDLLQECQQTLDNITTLNEDAKILSVVNFDPLFDQLDENEIESLLRVLRSLFQSYDQYHHVWTCSGHCTSLVQFHQSLQAFTHLLDRFHLEWEKEKNKWFIGWRGQEIVAKQTTLLKKQIKKLRLQVDTMLAILALPLPSAQVVAIPHPNQFTTDSSKGKQNALRKEDLPIDSSFIREQRKHQQEQIIHQARVAMD